jgi:hypothetical protein
VKKPLLVFLKHPVRNLLLIGLFIRIGLALTTMWPDAEVFSLLSLRDIVSPGNGAPLLNTYPVTWMDTISVFWAPLSHIIDPSHFTIPIPDYQTLVNLAGINLSCVIAPIPNLLLKAPCIISDIVIGFLIYSIVQNFVGKSKAKLAFGLWFLNPVVIVTGSISGMYDTIVALFTLLAIYLATKKVFFGAGLAFTVGFLFKPLSAFIAVLLVGITLSHGFMSFSTNRNSLLMNRKKSGSTIVLFRSLLPTIQLGLGVIIPLVFYLIGGKMIGAGIDTDVRLTFPVLGGLNFFLVQYIPVPQTQAIWLWANAHFTLIQYSGLLVTLLASITITFIAIKRSSRPYVVYLASSIILLIFLQFTTLLSSQYYMAAFAFLVLSLVLFDLPKYFFYILSVFMTLWFLFLWGPIFIWLPLAVTWHLIPSNNLIQWTANYVMQPGMLNTRLFLDLTLFFALGSFICSWCTICALIIKLVKFPKLNLVIEKANGENPK